MTAESTKLYILVSLFFIGTSALMAQNHGSQTGTASFYHDKFEGRKTANGEIFKQANLTGAHNQLPLGTWVKVTNLSNDSSVIVKINDRMAASNKRLIDLSEAAAQQLNYISKGLTKVVIEIIPDPTKKALAKRPDDLPLVPFKGVPMTQIVYPAPQKDIVLPADYVSRDEYAAALAAKKKRR